MTNSRLHLKRLTLFSFSLFLLTSLKVDAQESKDCILSAAECFNINPLIIKSIIWRESKNNQQAIRLNTNNSIDVGIMQINSINFGLLKSRGISTQQLKQNSCYNIFAGTWILNNAIHKNGYSWNSIGEYNSKTPVYHDAYVNGLITTIIHEQAKLKRIKYSSPDTDLLAHKFGCDTASIN